MDTSQLHSVSGLVGEGIIDGRFLQTGDTGKAVVDRHYAAFFGIKPGDTVKIGGEPFQAIGVVETKTSSLASAANYYISLPDAQALVKTRPDEVNQIYVLVTQPSIVEETVKRIRAAPGDVSAITEDSIVQVMGCIARISNRFTRVAALVALLGGLALTWLVLSASVTERTREIRLIKSVGWSRRQVGGYFLTEGLLLSILGAMIGLALGWLTTLILSQLPIQPVVLNPSMPAGMGFNAPATVPMTLPAYLSLPAILLAMCVAVGGGAIASWLIANRAALMKPADALRNT